MYTCEINELVKRYIYLYQNKELILALCIGRGIEKEKIKSNIKKCKDLIKSNSVCRENEKLNNLLKSQIEDYYLKLKTENYYLMSRVNKDIVSMFEDFLFSDDMMENSNLYKHIEAVKLNRKFLDIFNYSIELLEERRQTNIQLRKLPTFTVWRILSYVRRNNKGNKKILNALDKYYNLDRFIIAEDDCTTGYHMTESDYEDSERYYKYPNDIIIAGGIIILSYKNCFEEEDNYFDECPVLDETEKYADTNISDFLEVLANMPTLDIETKRSVRRKIISNKVLMK